MTRKRRSNRRRKSSAQLPMAIGLGTLLVGGLATGIYAYSTIGSETPIDSEFCYIVDEPQYQAAFYVDYSLTADASQRQIRDLKRSLTSAYGELPPNGRLSVFTSDRSAASTMTKPTFSICRPPNSKAEQVEAGTPEKNTQQLSFLTKKAVAGFSKKIDTLIEDAQDGDKVAHDSPILEDFQNIGRTHKRIGLDAFYAYTDGIQNTEEAQFCVTKGHLPPYRQFKTTATYRRTKLPQAFEGTEVTIYLIDGGQLPSPNLPYCTNNELQVWWPAHFENAGSTVSPVIRLRHGGA